MSPDPRDALRRLIRLRRVVVLVGSGVSRAATGGASEASWAGLLSSGVRRCRAGDPRLDEAWEKGLLREIESSDLDDMLSAAEKISRKLNAPGGAFAGWLRDTVGALKIRHPELLRAIQRLGVPLVTTNYDGLLEKATGLPPITWLDEGKVSRLLQREEDSAAILHVHGYWDRPDSVVLGIRSYEQVRQNEHAQAVLRALAMTQTLLFVGCGDGLRDPNFEPFLGWLASVNRARETPHYRLAREGEVVELTRHHPSAQRIQIVSYGKKHEDLVGFLDGLVPDDARQPAREVRFTRKRAVAGAVTPAVAAYLQRLSERVSTLQLLGLGRGVQIHLPIQDAYIPLQLAARLGLSDHRRGNSRDALADGSAPQEHDLDLSRVFESATRSGQRGVLILGDPGAGKTTGARQFAWRILHPGEAGETPGLPAGCVPVFLRLRDLSAELPAGGLKSFIAQQVASEALPDDLAQPGPDLIARRGVLWVFDGLDEVVNEDTRVTVCGWIARWLEDRTQDRVLVTSRFQGYQGRVDLGSGFYRFEVQPLRAEQSREFVRRWYGAVYRRLFPADAEATQRGAVEAQTLLGLLSEPVYRTGGLRELPANPLLLTILCLVHHEDHSLPRKRSDVYARCVRVLLEFWRQEVRQTQRLPSFDAEAAERVLGVLAWWLHEQEHRTTATLADLGQQATLALADVSLSSGLGRDGEAFARRMRDESGILAMWGGGQCGFLHLSFQEYLAGAYAARERQAADMVERLGRSWWREAILVSLSLGSRAFAQDFFGALLKTDPLGWDVSTVDQCLDEAAVVPIEPFVDALRDEGASSSRKAAILRRLKAFQHPELVVVCRDLTGSKDRELATLAAEIVQRAGGASKTGRVESVRQPFESFVDSRTGIAYVQLPAGEFRMGSERISDAERPAHQVRVSAFAMGKYPVTNAEYARFLEADPDGKPPKYWDSSQFNDPRQPVVGVSWNEAQAFCAWAGARLPTEAEWEYACRAAGTTEFCFGDEASQLGEYAWFWENSGLRTHPVGEKRANAWDLCDMHGNVWEWCEDAWDDRAYRTRGELVTDNPLITAEGSGGSSPARVIRGGSWNSVADKCRAAYRVRRMPVGRYINMGFRVCLGRSPVLLAEQGGKPAWSAAGRDAEAERGRDADRVRGAGSGAGRRA